MPLIRLENRVGQNNGNATTDQLLLVVVVGLIGCGIYFYNHRDSIPTPVNALLSGTSPKTVLSEMGKKNSIASEDLEKNSQAFLAYVYTIDDALQRSVTLANVSFDQVAIPDILKEKYTSSALRGSSTKCWRSRNS